MDIATSLVKVSIFGKSGGEFGGHLDCNVIIAGSKAIMRSGKCLTTNVNEVLMAYVS